MPTEILLPALTADFEAGNIGSWHKSEGDSVEVGDVLMDIETDKAVIEVEAVDSGTLGKILFPSGSTDVPVNAVVGLLLSESEKTDELENYAVVPANGESAAQNISVDRDTSPAASTVTEVVDDVKDRIFASPLARRIAAQLNVNLSEVQGRGPNGRILRADVQHVATSLSSSLDSLPSATANNVLPIESADNATEQKYTQLPHSKMRKVIASRLSEAKRNIPHFYLNVDCEIDALLALRKEVNAQSPEGSGAYRVSVNDFVIKACALALRDLPAANVSWSDDALYQYSDVDISIAVATSGGLITPILRNADRKGLLTVSREVKELAVRAREGKLQPQEYQGGGFSISNLGMYGIKQFSAIINPPQSCILAVGAGEQRPVVKSGELVAATVMNCTLSVDHRSVDGAMGAEFLQAIKRYIENPLTLLLSAG